MIQNVIFDVDGTLVDSVDLHAQCWQEAFEHFGHPVRYADIRAQIGKGGDNILPMFLSEDERAKMGKDLEEWREKRFMEKYLPHVKAFPKVRDLFWRLNSDGKKLALASSAKEPLLKELKKLINVDEFLAAETSSKDAEKSKPDPDIFAAALQRLGGALPMETIVVGDSPHDTAAATKLGMATISLLCGGFPKDALQIAGCLAMYRDPADLYAEYRESPIATPRIASARR